MNSPLCLNYVANTHRFILSNNLNQPSTSMSSFEEGTGTGRKIHSFNFCSSSFTYLFQHVRRILRNILACFRILLLTWNLIYM